MSTHRTRPSSSRRRQSVLNEKTVLTEKNAVPKPTKRTTPRSITRRRSLGDLIAAVYDGVEAMGSSAEQAATLTTMTVLHLLEASGNGAVAKRLNRTAEAMLVAEG